MPFIRETVEDGRGLVFTGSGRLSGAEIIEAKRALLTESPGLPPIRFTLVTLVEVTSLAITPDEVRELVGIDLELARWSPGMVVAIVAPRDLDFGMSRMWQALAEDTGWATGVFRSLPQAEAWLQERLAEER